MAQILLLETDHLLAKNLMKYLGKFEHVVVWQVDPQEAIEAADRSRPDVIVLDIIFANRRSGIEFLYELRSYPEWQNLPAIIFSCVAAQNLTGCMESMGQLKIFAYHYKPTTSLAQLAKTINQALEQPASV